MLVTPEKATAILLDLPDPEGARNFIERLEQAQSRAAKKLQADAGLYSDVVALAAWSPFLATTLLQHPEYLTWLARVRKQPLTRSSTELLESLGRFQGTHSQLTPHDLLARFRRRELLRIYLQDIRHLSTVSEITEEISHLADAIMVYALRVAQQEMENRFGAPLIRDETGRVAPAELVIVALGKLGSAELNFASDVDLMFLFSADGTTSGRGTKGETSNREFFNRLARTVVQMVGDQSGEGAAYRVDLRLRPFGRDGTLASSVTEAINYYESKAQAWELQALIRSRCAAGAEAVFDRFAAGVAPFVYSRMKTWADVAEGITAAKSKIDLKVEQGNGEFNVKLAPGGIREIEFIAQAQGMARGGKDRWLRAPHTLIALGRLEERRLISTQDRVELFEAYEFLRTLEHRLQMEEGLQTHLVPLGEERRLLVARRMGFAGPDALRNFDRTLDQVTSNVKRIFDRVLSVRPTTAAESVLREAKTGPLSFAIAPRDRDEAEKQTEKEIAGIFARHLTRGERSVNLADCQQLLAMEARQSGGGGFLTTVAKVAASLDRSDVRLPLSRDDLAVFFRLCAESDHFGEVVSANPILISALAGFDPARIATGETPDLDTVPQVALGDRLGALRRGWSSAMIRLAAHDANRSMDIAEGNRRQTQLAELSLQAAWKIALDESTNRLGTAQHPFTFAVLGLGRLGGRGMDYGSDLDVILVYDDQKPSPYEGMNGAEVYSRAAEYFVGAISSLTRDGYLYRVDLRLRPDGRNGPICSGSQAFLDYLRTRSQPWEWLAYVKLRAAAGDLAWGQQVETEARAIIHRRAREFDEVELRQETRRVRDRLEKERSGRRGGTDIKYGAGGMLDVYFVTRYLQLRFDLPDEDQDRSTVRSLERLGEAGALSELDRAELAGGYGLLREVDHHLRLAIGRVRHPPPPEHPVWERIAARMDRTTPEGLILDIQNEMRRIRAAYLRILS